VGRAEWELQRDVRTAEDLTRASEELVERDFEEWRGGGEGRAEELLDSAPSLRAEGGRNHCWFFLASNAAQAVA
jgi:hypothetical protein